MANQSNDIPPVSPLAICLRHAPRRPGRKDGKPSPETREADRRSRMIPSCCRVSCVASRSSFDSLCCCETMHDASQHQARMCSYLGGGLRGTMPFIIHVSRATVPRRRFHPNISDAGSLVSEQVVHSVCSHLIGYELAVVFLNACRFQKHSLTNLPRAKASHTSDYHPHPLSFRTAPVSFDGFLGAPAKSRRKPERIEVVEDLGQLDEATSPDLCLLPSSPCTLLNPLASSVPRLFTKSPLRTRLRLHVNSLPVGRSLSNKSAGS